MLVGPPELEDKLKRPELRQFRQRIALQCKTAPLTLEESHGYIAERLRIGGASAPLVFSSDAVEMVQFYSRKSRRSHKRLACTRTGRTDLRRRLRPIVQACG